MVTGMVVDPSTLRDLGRRAMIALAAMAAFCLAPAGRADHVMGAGDLLGLARISWKTAPLLVTSPGNPFLSWRVDQPVASLPTVMFHAALAAYADWRALAWAGALLIAAAVLAAGIVGCVPARGRDGP